MCGVLDSPGHVDPTHDAERPPLAVKNDEERVRNRIQSVEYLLHVGLGRGHAEPAGHVITDFTGGLGWRLALPVGVQEIARHGLAHSPEGVAGYEQPDAAAEGIDHRGGIHPAGFEWCGGRADARWTTGYGGLGVIVTFYPAPPPQHALAAAFS